MIGYDALLWNFLDLDVERNRCSSALLFPPSLTSQILPLGFVEAYGRPLGVFPTSYRGGNTETWEEYGLETVPHPDFQTGSA